MADTTSPTPPPAALELRTIVKRYGAGLTEVRALTDVSVRIEPGELVAVMGPSGCGKSTMLHLAGALEDPDAGQVLVDGLDLSTLSPAQQATLRRTDVGFVFQRLNLVPSLTAMENVMLPMELERVPAREARERARAALVSVGIVEQLDRFPDDFSGGQQQRIAVARAIVGTRKLILADEPTGALDTMTGDAVIELMAGLPAATGAAVVLVTHEPRYAAWADRVVFMRDGRIVDESSVAPASPPAPRAVPAGVSS
jgi:putative ABC transport system ATP-binding protein